MKLFKNDLESRRQFLAAVENGRIDVVKELLARGGIDVNMTTAACSLTLQTAVKLAHHNSAALYVNASGLNRHAWYFAKSLNARDEIRGVLAAAALEQCDVDLQRDVDDGCTPLIMATMNGHAHVAQLLVDAGADVCAASAQKGCFALLFAAKSGAEPLVRSLLANGADVNQSSVISGTPLHAAVRYRHVGVVGALLAAGAAVNQVRGDDISPLFVAAQAGHREIVEMLLAEGANLSQTCSTARGATPLSIAAAGGHVATVQLLLASGAAVDRAMTNGGTALHVAAQNGCADVACLLLDSGADGSLATKEGETPLYIAAYFAHFAVVDTLLEKLPRAGVCEHEPLFDAVVTDDSSLLRQLFTTQLVANNGMGASLLHVAAHNGSEASVRALVELGVSVDERDVHGANHFHRAMDSGRVDVLRLLLRVAGTDLADQLRSDGIAPLYRAALNGCVPVLKLLLTETPAFVDWTRPSDLSTPLHAAAGRGHVDAVRVLLAHRAGVNEVTHTGATPLFIAAREGHESVIKLLLEHGASVNQARYTRNSDGATPWEVATRHGHVRAAKLLSDSGGGRALNVNSQTSWQKAAASGNVERIERLLAMCGAQRAVQRIDCFFVLHTAAHCGHERVVNVLLENGANVKHVRPEDGATVLIAALRGGHASLQLLNALVAHGADVNRDCWNDGETPLFCAVRNGDVPAVRLLLGYGADVDRGKVDRHDNIVVTPLCHAWQNGNDNVTPVLLAHGAHLEPTEKKIVNELL